MRRVAHPVPKDNGDGGEVRLDLRRSVAAARRQCPCAQQRRRPDGRSTLAAGEAVAGEAASAGAHSTAGDAVAAQGARLRCVATGQKSASQVFCRDEAATQQPKSQALTSKTPSGRGVQKGVARALTEGTAPRDEFALRDGLGRRGGGGGVWRSTVVLMLASMSWTAKDGSCATSSPSTATEAMEEARALPRSSSSAPPQPRGNRRPALTRRTCDPCMAPSDMGHRSDMGHS